MWKCPPEEKKPLFYNLVYIPKLVTDEDWEPVAAVQRISSPLAISSLPLRFQDLMVSALDHLMEYVSFRLCGEFRSCSFFSGESKVMNYFKFA